MSKRIGHLMRSFRFISLWASRPTSGSSGKRRSTPFSLFSSWKWNTWIGHRVSSKKCLKIYWQDWRMRVFMCKKLYNSVFWVFVKWKNSERSVKNCLLNIINPLKNFVKNNSKLETCNKLKLMKEKKSWLYHCLSKFSIKLNTKAQKTSLTQQILFWTCKSISLHKRIHKKEPL